ncbi:MAG: hypothetical protein Ct9H300mP12_05520 [Acidimicrobiales bacterium]|nr:MAG: hypothetical protein Ct9H300mP12_05520 [Acidimicrobiales bacterium]
MGPPGVGLLAAVFLLAGVIEETLIEHPEPMAGLFLGLVAASVLITGRGVEWTAGRLAAAGLVGLALFVALGWQGAPVPDPEAPALFGAGAVAICAMVLPGISGSFLLLMMGMYASLIDIIDNRLLADAAIFGAGAVFGLACFSTLLARLLADRPHEVLAVMVGLLLGSTRVLWPWPHGVGVVSHQNRRGRLGNRSGLARHGRWTRVSHRPSRHRDGHGDGRQSTGKGLRALGGRFAPTQPGTVIRTGHRTKPPVQPEFLASPLD